VEVVSVTTWVLLADDGYGCHIESGLKYVSLCGRTFDPDDVEREHYENPSDHDHPHASLCFDCHTVGVGGEIDERRREIHFDGGASA
jgi:hypothetical protein